MTESTSIDHNLKVAPATTDFPTSFEAILKRVDAVDPLRYGQTRNFVNGKVSYLSPYISRGVISTKFVLERTLANGLAPAKAQKWISELAWGDYFQRVWQTKGDLIHSDLRHAQPDVLHHGMPVALLHANTGIKAVDEGLKQLYRTGYMHNHMRMYAAAIACNLGKSHWKTPAKWLYYHLLDGDLASNNLSWQWVAGCFSNKKYYCNQENINRYTLVDQRQTFLDHAYEQLPELDVPHELRAIATPDLQTKLPITPAPTFKKNLPLLIYNTYNLDPLWRTDTEANRVLLLEPSHFQQFPVAGKVIDFVLELAKNIAGLEVYSGEITSLLQAMEKAGTITPLTPIFYKEHPTTLHYRGAADNRDWMVPEVEGYFPGFFAYWKKIEKRIMKMTQ